MTDTHPDTDQLLRRVAEGDQNAAQDLLARHRPRLRRMVTVHLDTRISARVDPSDVVQEALAEAFQRLPSYASEPAVSFYPWLRQIAWQRLVKLHRHHLKAARRSVHREQDRDWSLSDESIGQLAERFVSERTDPGRKAIRQEMRQRVRTALDQLLPADRELLVMRYLEHLTIREIAETLDLTQASIKMRQARALERLQKALASDP
ncbi:sigma-70 family RNA polymerase sigma factor [Aeoliella sp. ICT_H6.2]|uniref:Sigma-70 family RNA polymerase sigma factor n=1 Tax=Aeoliella straminimaris TaxID=2954799 RepID=A0A9X2JHC9_9BACT|nr:sigma-70 family RNA polymerase sigma factor [Aeoliella straminimaris]MCO6045925.1 sigma-70 family RNA polymerase sigma factor [Aeoliella straminimaris]